MEELNCSKSVSCSTLNGGQMVQTNGLLFLKASLHCSCFCIFLHFCFCFYLMWLHFLQWLKHFYIFASIFCDCSILFAVFSVTQNIFEFLCSKIFLGSVMRRRVEENHLSFFRHQFPDTNCPLGYLRGQFLVLFCSRFVFNKYNSSCETSVNFSFEKSKITKLGVKIMPGLNLESFVSAVVQSSFFNWGGPSNRHYFMLLLCHDWVTVTLTWLDLIMHPSHICRCLKCSFLTGTRKEKLITLVLASLH